MNIQSFKKLIKKGIAIGLCAVCVMGTPVIPASTTVANAATTSTVTSVAGTMTQNANLRKGPTTEFAVITALSKGDTVVVKSRVWGKVYEVTAIHNGKAYTGYVQASYVKTSQEVPASMERKTVPMPDQTGNKLIGLTYYATTAVNLRKSATAAADIIVCLSAGDKCVVKASGMGWFKMLATHNGKSYTGFVYSAYVSTTKPATTTKTTNTTTKAVAKGTIGYVNYDYLNVRAKATTSSSKIGKLYKSQSVTILKDTTKGWYQIQYVSGKTTKKGYVAAQYISFATKGTLNAKVTLRKKASASSAAITTLKSGTKVTVVSEAKGWMKVKCTVNKKTVTGYVLAELINM